MTQLASSLTETELLYAAKQYKLLSAQIRATKQAITPYKETLELACTNAPGYRLELPEGISVVLSEVSKEYFKLADAKTELGEILDPFISVSCFTQMRVR